MFDVVLFGGTDEGHKIADFLIEKNIKHIVCVATEYGAELIKNENVRVGRMDVCEMRGFFAAVSPKIVIDATHPYADKVTENIKNSCPCEYIRVVRDEENGAGKRFDDVQSAAEYLAGTEGNILLTTGSKEIAQFSAIAKRAYARVLPVETSIRSCIDAGFERGHIISASPPFSVEQNRALIREKNIRYLVTKSTGKSGGFPEKIEAAHAEGAECVIINRPVDEVGLTVAETKKKVLELLV